MQLSLTMSRPYPRQKILSAPWLSTEWNPKIVHDLLERLTPQQCRIMIASQEPIEGRAYERKEQWYGTEYTIVPMSQKLLEVSSVSTARRLRRSRCFVRSYRKSPRPTSRASRFRGPTHSFLLIWRSRTRSRWPRCVSAIRCRSETDKPRSSQPSKRPLSLRNNPVARLWYKKDDRWWVPRAGAFILLRRYVLLALLSGDLVSDGRDFNSPLIDDTALHSVQSRLFTELVRDSLSEYSYDADLAGLRYTFDSQADAILLTIEGYNDKLAVLAKVVLERIRTLKVDPERFSIIMDQVRSSKGEPRSGADSLLSVSYDARTSTAD
jgi:insulysin